MAWQASNNDTQQRLVHRDERCCCCLIFLSIFSHLIVFATQGISHELYKGHACLACMQILKKVGQMYKGHACLATAELTPLTDINRIGAK
ncbi:hypothetical protein DAI22_01g207772 [Oryza sativa Japonica Group]|nr:hypothetical protein DAI22_05g046400 [Oryza sativa Japonica Group]KAF2950721.1 hypothetical protein DAI22_01g207772 [Oryza sativa Japonica Group]